MNKLIVSALAFLPMVASAQDDPYGTDLTGINLGEGDATEEGLKQTIISIVNIILGFLGILATLIVLLGGFKWMTSQGNTEKVDEAKKLIGAGVVGLVIILVSYTVVRFVFATIDENVFGGG